MGLASRIGTYLGPFQGFGPKLNQVPNLGPHYEHCSWILSFPRPDFPKPKLFPRPNFSQTKTEIFFPKPNFPKPKPRLFSETKFFRNRNRDFFPKPNFPKPKPKPSKIWQKFRNREVSKPKCQSLATAAPILFTCSAATLWKPPRVSMAMGRKAIPWSWQACAAPCTFRLKAFSKAAPDSAAAACTFDCARGPVTVTSRAPSFPSTQRRIRTSPGRATAPGRR